VLLHQRLQAVQLPLGVPDQLQWRWSPNGTYSSRSAYAALMFEQLVIPGARELWKTHAPNKCRFFIWLVLLRRCWTADRRFRRGLQADNSCALCSQEPELVDHLVIQCVFSREVWFSALRRCGWHHLAPSADDSFVTWWVHSRKQVAKEHRKAFNSLIIAIVWSIWLERNERCFARSCKSPTAVVRDVWNSVDMWCRQVQRTGCG
jgi:hypothetical protein